MVEKIKKHISKSKFKKESEVRPSIDHSLLSPSGSMSKRSRKAALERERIRLFGKKGLPFPKGPVETRKNFLLRNAKQLEDLASRGMKPRKFRKQAKLLRLEASKLNSTEIISNKSDDFEGKTFNIKSDGTIRRKR